MGGATLALLGSAYIQNLKGRELRSALVARENQLAANLLAPTLKANVRLAPVTLGQKWVSAHINIHCSENSEYVLPAPPECTLKSINTHTRRTKPS